MMNGRKLMEEESNNLAPVTSHSEGLEVYFLTGEKYLYQTLYCIQSLAAASTVKFQFILVDDGSFNAHIIRKIKRQLPGARIISHEEISQNLKTKLPESSFPNIHNKRKVYPHLKKITDIHTIPGRTWKLVLDSDMLFWAEPTDIIKWLNKPQKPMHMVDCTEAYGYSIKLMEHLAGTPITPLINVGAIGLNSDAINWGKLEAWIKALEDEEGASYYLEQALTAMLIGDAAATVLKPGEYIVNPTENAIINKKGILQHYVDLSKKGYFTTAWKAV